MAVGQGAQAHQTIYLTDRLEDLVAAVGSLRQGLDACDLQPHAREEVSRDVGKLELAVRSQKPDADQVQETLGSLAGKLKMVGVVLAEVRALSEPVKSIATLLGISPAQFGLS